MILPTGRMVNLLSISIVVYYKRHMKGVYRAKLLFYCYFIAFVSYTQLTTNLRSLITKLFAFTARKKRRDIVLCNGINEGMKINK